MIHAYTIPFKESFCNLHGIENNVCISEKILLELVNEIFVILCSTEKRSQNGL